MPRSTFCAVRLDIDEDSLATSFVREREDRQLEVGEVLRVGELAVLEEVREDAPGSTDPRSAGQIISTCSGGEQSGRLSWAGGGGSVIAQREK